MPRGIKKIKEELAGGKEDPNKDLKDELKDEPKNPENKVSVNEDALQKLLTRMDKLEEENELLKKQSEALADKGRLQRFRVKMAPKLGRVVRLNLWNGLVITGWDTLSKNLCEKSHTGAWREEVERTLHLEDGSEIVVPYVDAARHIEYRDATIQSQQETDEVIDNDGNVKVLLTVIDEDGKEWVIDNRFIN